MGRLKDYLRIAALNSGVGYIALWAMTLWTLDRGPAVFGKSGLCHPDAAKVVFYWVCDAATPLSILAEIANTALTVTVWSPVYIAAATVRPDAIVIAAPIIAAHLIGLPMAIFVAIRVMLALFRVPRRVIGGSREPDAVVLASDLAAARLAREAARRPVQVGSRTTFGRRGVTPD